MKLPVLGVLLQIILLTFSVVWINFSFHLPGDFRKRSYWIFSFLGPFIVILGNILLILYRFLAIQLFINIGIMCLVFGMATLSIGIMGVTIRLRKLYQITKNEALTDCLTGLPNRRFFDIAIQKEIDRTSRFNDHFCLIIADVDNFKLVNDTKGHQVGDAVLKEIANHMISNVRRYDTVFRFAGDEFAIILPNTVYMGAERIVNRIKDNIETLAGSLGLDFGLSLGIACFPQDSSNVDNLIKIADERMFNNKRKLVS